MGLSFSSAPCLLPLASRRRRVDWLGMLVRVCRALGRGKVLGCALENLLRRVAGACRRRRACAPGPRAGGLKLVPPVRRPRPRRGLDGALEAANLFAVRGWLECSTDNPMACPAALRTEHPRDPDGDHAVRLTLNLFQTRALGLTPRTSASEWCYRRPHLRCEQPTKRPGSPRRMEVLLDVR